MLTGGLFGARRSTCSLTGPTSTKTLLSHYVLIETSQAIVYIQHLQQRSFHLLFLYIYKTKETDQWDSAPILDLKDQLLALNIKINISC